MGPGFVLGEAGLAPLFDRVSPDGGSVKPYVLRSVLEVNHRNLPQPHSLATSFYNNQVTSVHSNPKPSAQTTFLR